jgi:antirestriction protein ArdC
MISHLRDSDLRVSWQRLLTEAVTQPGTLHEGYTRFWNYSIGNQILAMIQCRARGLQPGPLATFERWKQLGRYVKKGELALTLCMPITLKGKEWDQKRAENGSSAGHGENGNGPRTVFVYKKRWFVLAQTEGKAYEPEPIPEWDREAALKALGIQEEPFSMLDGNCQGYATKDRKIAVSPVAVLAHKTFFHEVAHIVLGHVGGEPMTDGEKLTRSLQEVEAEAVALICCETLGLPGADEARGYIQHWLAGEENVSEKTAQRIFQASDRILRKRAQSGMPVPLTPLVS